MNAKIFEASFNIDQFDLNDFIELMKCNTIIAFDVIKSQFNLIDNKLGPAMSERNYIQDFCTTGVAGYLYYYRPENFERDKVEKILEQLHNAQTAY